MKIVMFCTLLLISSCIQMEMPGYAFEMVKWMASNHHEYTVTKLPLMDEQWFSSFSSYISALDYLDIYIAKDREAGVPLDDELSRIANSFPQGTSPRIIRDAQKEVYQVYSNDEDVREAENIYGFS